MAFPGNKIHRRNRRHLQPGQGPFAAPITTAATPSGSTVVLNYSGPVNVSGTIPITVAGLTFVSQVVNSPTQVTVTMSGAVATKAYTTPTNPATVSTFTGGAVLGSTGTFP